jgi:hypothetical protein
MVLSGEGSDEVFGGYLYFHKAPNRVGAFLVLWVLGDRLGGMPVGRTGYKQGVSIVTRCAKSLKEGAALLLQ